MQRSRVLPRRWRLAVATLCLSALQPARAQLPTPPGFVELSRNGEWQVLQGSTREGRHPVCVIANMAAGAKFALTLKHSGDARDVVFLAILRPETQAWGTTPGTMIPVQMWIDGGERQPGAMMIANDRSVVIEREDLDAWPGIAAASVAGTASLLHMAFTLSGEELSVSMAGFPASMAIFRECESRAGLPTGQTVQQNQPTSASNSTLAEEWSIVVLSARKFCGIDLSRTPINKRPVAIIPGDEENVAKWHRANARWSTSR